jgi:hypothetical protein
MRVGMQRSVGVSGRPRISLAKDDAGRSWDLSMTALTLQADRTSSVFATLTIGAKPARIASV